MMFYDEHTNTMTMNYTMTMTYNIIINIAYHVIYVLCIYKYTLNHYFDFRKPSAELICGNELKVKISQLI